MTLFPLDAVRNARIDRSLEPTLQHLREMVARFPWRCDGIIDDPEDALDVFDISRARLNVIVQMVRAGPHASGTDIGTGLGFLPVVLDLLGIRASATTCIDPLADFAVAHGIDLQPFCLGRERPPLTPASLDFVVLGEVLEHLRLPPIQVIGVLAELLRPGGQLVLSTPNIARRAHVEALLAGENFLEPLDADAAWGADATASWEHVREYSLREVVEAVEAVGLEVKEAVMTGWGEAGYEPLANPFANEIIVVRATR